ncbi:DUF1492 domain-containing protein [Streptococcus hyovaginalis]
MSKGQTEADELLNELRIIPKIIKTLAEDSEAIRGSLLTSPQWSDMRVTGGVRQSQENKNIKVIDKSEYHQAEIEKLIKRREEITSIIMQLPMVQAHVLNVTYLKCDSYDEAMDYLDIHNRNKYFKNLRIAKEKLNLILKNTE